MDLVKMKSQMFCLDLDYPIKNMSLETQTNLLVNKVMNDFVKLYEKENIKNVIIDFKDDLLSVICYRLIKNIQTVSPFKFNIYIRGKRNNSKDYLSKEDKRIFAIKYNKMIEQDDTVLITPFNPLYQVVNSRKRFNKIGLNIFAPLKSFTPMEIEQIQIFYHIGYFKKDSIKLNSKIVKDFSSLCRGEKEYIPKIDFFGKYYYNDIIVVKLCGDNTIDEPLLNKIEGVSELVFYFGKSELLNSNFVFSLKHKYNLPYYNNLNNWEIVKEFIKKYNTNILYFGDWSDNEKLKLEGVI